MGRVGWGLDNGPVLPEYSGISSERVKYRFCEEHMEITALVGEPIKCPSGTILGKLSPLEINMNLDNDITYCAIKTTIDLTL